MRKSRENSLTRQAFSAGAQGALKQIACEVFPNKDPGTAVKKLSRMLGWQPGDDLNLLYEAADEILATDPESVLRVLHDALGFEPPRRRVVDVDATLRNVDARVAELVQQLEDIKADRASRERGRDLAITGIRRVGA